jgi:hypothetical protein
MKHLHILAGFAAITASSSIAILHSTLALAGPSEELNAYTFPESRVVGIPGACRMIKTGSNPEKEAECAEWGRKFQAKARRSQWSSTPIPTSTRKSIQTLSCYTTGGVYSNLGNCR